MSSVQWKGETAYEVYRNPGSRKLIWKRLNARTEKEAREEAKIREGERLRSRRDGAAGTSSEPREIAWAEMVKKYLAVGAGDGICAATLARKEMCFKHIDRLMGIQMTSDWTAERLQDFKQKCRAEKYAPGTTNKELGYIKAVLRLARRRKYIAPDADEISEVRQVKNRPPMPRYYTPEEQAKLLAVATPFWRVAVMLGGLAGLRRGEVMSLRWRDISFTNRELHIADREEWREKTRRAKTVPLHDDLLKVLTEWRAANPGQTMVLPWDKGANEFSHAFKRLCKKAGLTGSFKALRHAFGTMLALADVNAMKIQAAMGHASVKTTQVYTHVAARDLHDVVRKLPSPLAVRDNGANQLLTKSGKSADPKQPAATSTSTGEGDHG